MQKMSLFSTLFLAKKVIFLVNEGTRSSAVEPRTHDPKVVSSNPDWVACFVLDLPLSKVLIFNLLLSTQGSRCHIHVLYGPSEYGEETSGVSIYLSGDTLYMPSGHRS